MADVSSFFSELKRRHVWRVAIAYAVVGWLVVQVATQVFPFFDIPDWIVRLVVVALALGFPVALVLAWAFEITPEGVRRTEPADSPAARADHDTRAIGRKLNATVIAVLSIAVLLLLGNQFLWHRGMRDAAPAPRAPASAVQSAVAAGTAGAPNSTADVAASALPTPNPATPGSDAAAAIPQKSVAVLPFTNEGAESEQFFSDGLSEDLINALSQFEGLKVISRNSAFQFRTSKDSSAKIGAALGVAHLLEGSVQRAGDAVRITAALVNASDGRILWSQRYDKPYKDLFALQDAITEAVATALKAELLTTPGAVVQSDRPPGGNLDAYAAYQHGIAYDALGTEAGARQSIDAYGEAIRLDPQYAAAYAQLGRAWSDLATRYRGGADANAKARVAIDSALKLDPAFALAHQARAYQLLTGDMDWIGAEVEYRRALQLSPNDAAAQHGLGLVLAILGQNQRSVALFRQALASDPRSARSYNWLAHSLTALGRLDEARQSIDTAIALQPGGATHHEQLAIIEVLGGDAGAALNAAHQEPPGWWHAFAMALALQVGPDRAAADAVLEQLIKDYGGTGIYQIAQVYALRRDPDNAFHWLDRAWTGRDAGVAYLLNDPLILRYRDDPRFAAFAKRVGLPTTTDAVAMK